MHLILKSQYITKSFSTLKDPEAELSVPQLIGIIVGITIGLILIIVIVVLMKMYWNE